MKYYMMFLLFLGTAWIHDSKAQCPQQIEVEVLDDLEGGDCEVKVTIGKKPGVGFQIGAVYYGEDKSLAKGSKFTLSLQNCPWTNITFDGKVAAQLIEVDTFSDDDYGMTVKDFGNSQPTKVELVKDNKWKVSW